MDMRQQKGLEIARRGKIKETPKGWIVNSQSGKGAYLVYREGRQTFCTCPDCEMRGVKCKHQFAVDQFVQKTIDSEGRTTITKAVRVTYPQNWKAYNTSQTSEISLFDRLLKDLVGNAKEPDTRMLYSLLWETGGRIGEVLSLFPRHIIFDDEGALITLYDRKTKVTRIVRVVEISASLRDYIRDPNQKLFTKNYPAYRERFKKDCERAGIVKNDLRFHIFRHTRASYLSNFLTEQQIKKYMGWTPDSKMMRVYIHLASEDVNSAILKLHRENGRMVSCI